jgi:hypothetical protein
MKADLDGPDGVPARVLCPAGAGRLAVLLYPDVGRFGGGTRCEQVDGAIVPEDLRAEGSYLLLVPEAKGADRRFTAAMALPRFELRLEVPGPFRRVHGHEFTRRVVAPLEEALGRLGLSNYVHPWSFPLPDDDEWDCMYTVTDLRRAIEVTRETLAGLPLHPESAIVVWCPEERPLRTYPLARRNGAEEWEDLPEVKREARYYVEEAVHRVSPC